MQSPEFKIPYFSLKQANNATDSTGCELESKKTYVHHV